MHDWRGADCRKTEGPWLRARKARWWPALATCFAVACFVGSLTAPAQAATFEFPSSFSTVVAGPGAPADQAGYFWSKARGDKVSQAFVGPLYVDHVALTVQPAQNVLSAGAEVDWTLAINGVDIGSFVVPSGTTAPILLERSFAPIAGPNYAIELRVTNEVGSGQGSITLASTGNPGAHVIDLANVVAPDTTLSGGPPATTTAKSTSFSFASSQSDVTGFQCSLDHTGFLPCTSPRSYSGLSLGAHTFEVSAVDTGGNADPTPASQQWTVKCKKGFRKGRRHGKPTCIKVHRKHRKHRHH